LQTAQLKHIIVTNEAILGPIQTEHVVKLFEKDPLFLKKVNWITPDGRSPLLVFEWFADFAQDADLDKILAQVSAAQSQRPQPSQSSEQLPGEPGSSEGANPVVPSTRIRTPWRWLRDLFALLGLGVLGAALLIVGVRSQRPHRSQLRNERALTAKLLGSTPDALRTYQLLLEGKLTRDLAKYSSALLRIQKDKALYPDGQLPSAEFTAAMALVALNHDELDKKEEWKQLLMSLSPEARQRGLAVVAYELSRMMETRKLLREKLKESRKSLSNAVSSRALQEINIVLERLTRVIPGSEPEEKILHGMLLARVLSLSLITTLEIPLQVNQTADMKVHLEKVKALYSYLSTADRGAIEILLQLTQKKMEAANQKLDWSKALESFAALNSSTRLLCQLNETGAGADTALFLLSQTAVERQRVPDLTAIFDTCFVGLRAYPRASAQSFANNSANVLEFVGAGSVDEGLLRKFRVRFPTLNPALKSLSGAKNSVGDWLLVLQFNDILGGRLIGSQKTLLAKEKLCGKAQASSLCAQARWYETRGRWRELAALIPEYQEFLNGDELTLFIQSLVIKSVREILTSKISEQAKEIRELLKSLESYGVADDPQLQFVFDYVNSLAVSH